jgi:hypothetical protein
LNNKIIKLYICPEVPDEGYIEAKDIEEARDILNCEECFEHGEIYDSDCTPKQISLVYEALVNENAELRREIAELQKELQKYRDSE